MINSYTSSDTEAGLPGGNHKPKFSLYSTDTEEQVASVNRGLDRCAALLKSLLSPDNTDGNDQQREAEDLVQEGAGCERLHPTTLSSKLQSVKAFEHTAADKSPEREVQKHTHPHASSTPIPSRGPTHLRSATEPRALNDLAGQVMMSSTEHKALSDPARQVAVKQDDEIRNAVSKQHTKPLPGPGIKILAQTDSNLQDLPGGPLHVPLKGSRVVRFGKREDIGKERRPKRAHRRLQSEPRKPFVVSRNPPKPRPVVGVRARPTRQSIAATVPSTEQKPVVSVATHKQSTMTNATTSRLYKSKPAPLPSQYQYPPLYGPLPYLPYPPPLPTSSQASTPPTPWPSPETNYQDQPPSWFPYFPLWFPYIEQPKQSERANKPATGATHASSQSNEEGFHRHKSNPLNARPGDEATTSNTAPTAQSTVAPISCTNTVTCSSTPVCTPDAPLLVATSNVSSGVNRQRRCYSAPLTRQHSDEVGPVEEVETGVMMEVARIEQTLKEAGHPELLSCLDPLKKGLNDHLKQVPLPALTTSHWLGQIGQLEQEKTQLLQRVIESETAYSEAMGELELARKEKGTFHHQVECLREELSVLREDLQSAKQALSLMESQHMVTKEEYSEARQLAETHSNSLKEENKQLRSQVTSLEIQLSTSNKESSVFPGRLSELQQSMDTAQEEFAMIRLTITEKDAQLLQTQDQLLGLRQCLAHLLSEFKPMDNSTSCQHDCGNRYTLSSHLVDKLHTLVDNGNVDRFLLETSKCSTGDSSSHSESLHQSDQNSSLSTEDGLDNTLTEYKENTLRLNTQGRGPASLSSASNQVITPLNLSTEPHQPLPNNDSASVSTLTPSHHSLPSLSTSLKRLTANPSPLTASSVVSRGLDTQSCVTTSSEVEFRKDLASLDADIARLQIQFRVALQTSS